MHRFQRIPPRRPTPWRRTLALWATLAAGLGALLTLVAWSERLPGPAPETAPATAVSAARAWPALAYLADSAGHRVPGTPEHERAREYLLRRLRAIPGVEVDTQDALGARAGMRQIRAYHVRNVIARIPGRQPTSVLVSSHYDSPAESVGAADAAAPVATMLEMARALAAGPTPEHTVVFHFNDAEEQGLLGAHAFLRHPWFGAVRAFLNLESAGNEGKAILFQAGPGNDWLAARYARSAPHPYGSVIGQDIFQSGLIPSGTDFEVYTGGGARGLDVAFYRGGWAYHTALDRAAAVDPGSVQHMGDNALATVRALAAGPLPGDVHGSPSVYYDVLGVVMLAYDHATAAILAALALVLLAWALRRVTTRGLTPGREIVVAALFAALGVVLAALLALLGAAAGPFALGRAHGWFAHPARAAVAYGALALTGLLAAQWLQGRRRHARDLAPGERAVASWCGALLVLAVALAALTAAGIGSGYLFLWWVLGGALGLLVLTAGRARRWWAAIAVGVLPGAILTAQTAYLLVELFVPIAGRFPAHIPFDLVLAGVIGIPTSVLLVVPVALLQRGERMGAAAALALAGSLAGLVTVWLSDPYTPQRPQRLVVVHEDDGATATIALAAMDYPGVARVAAAIDAAPSAIGADGVLRLGAPPLTTPPAEVTLLAERPTPGGGREIELAVRAPGAYEVTLHTPEARTASWRIAGVRDATPRAVPRLVLIASPDSGWRITLRVADRAPLPLDVATRRHRPSPAADSLLARLPAWTTAYGETVARRRIVY
ncbi:MAG TPA: M28 family metallopeptidase [Gemmatimonadaceae bacterium]|nr:M28 family metallopeptidase [Gemmatimonadaceae bacterium]